jgi:hypothetical protein
MINREIKCCVADPGCYPGSRILIPDFYPSQIPDLGSRIPDPKTATKERDEKNSLNFGPINMDIMPLSCPHLRSCLDPLSAVQTYSM